MVTEGRDNVKLRRAIRKYITKNPNTDTRIITKAFGKHFSVPKQCIAADLRWLHTRNKKYSKKREIDIVTIVPGIKSLSRIAYNNLGNKHR